MPDAGDDRRWSSSGCRWPALVYAYFGYPLLLRAAGPAPPARGPRRRTCRLPTVVAARPGAQRARQHRGQAGQHRGPRYPAGASRSSSSPTAATDGTVEYIAAHVDARTTLIELQRPRRQGRRAQRRAAGAPPRTSSSSPTPRSCWRRTPSSAIVQPFADPRDRLRVGRGSHREAAAKGLYGRYELFVRRRRVASRLDRRRQRIVLRAAPASLRARSSPNLAPDFWSVLRCVEQGYRAVVRADGRRLDDATSRA